MERPVSSNVLENFRYMTFDFFQLLFTLAKLQLEFSNCSKNLLGRPISLKAKMKQCYILTELFR